VTVDIDAVFEDEGSIDVIEDDGTIDATVDIDAVFEDEDAGEETCFD